jgi:hypothetical protein
VELNASPEDQVPPPEGVLKVTVFVPNTTITRR